MKNTYIKSVLRDKKYLIGDIVLVDLSEYNIGEFGVRPCVVVQNNTGNFFSTNLLLVPLTTQLKKTKQPTHVIIEGTEAGLHKKSMALCECVLTVSKSSVVRTLGQLSNYELEMVCVGVLCATGILAFVESNSLDTLRQESIKLNFGIERLGQCTI